MTAARRALRELYDRLVAHEGPRTLVVARGPNGPEVVGESGLTRALHWARDALDRSEVRGGMLTERGEEEIVEMLDACVDRGRGFRWGPCHPEGGFGSREDVAAYLADVARKSVEVDPDRARELWGVFVERDGRSPFVCLTGNGPTSEAHAKFIAAAPESVRKLLDEIELLRGALRSEQAARRSAAAWEEEAERELATVRAQFDTLREAAEAVDSAQVGVLDEAEGEARDHAIKALRMLRKALP